MKKVQLTEPTLGKRNEDPFNRIISKEKENRSKELIQQDDSRSRIQINHHHRTPPPGQTKKQIFGLEPNNRQRIHKFDLQSSFELPQMDLKE